MAEGEVGVAVVEREESVAIVVVFVEGVGSPWIGAVERMVSELFHYLFKGQSCSVCGQDQVIYGIRGFWVYSQ